MKLAQPGAYATNRAYVLPDSLDDLQGPTEGAVELPHSIDWGSDRLYDLSDLDDTRWMYSHVIIEAATVEQLNTLLNRDRLIELWTVLAIPARARTLWTDRYPVLADRIPG